VRGWTPDGQRWSLLQIEIPLSRTLSAFGRSTSAAQCRRRSYATRNTGVFSPDGRRLAYEEFSVECSHLAQNQPVMATLPRRPHPPDSRNELADYSVEQLPWDNSNDHRSKWIGNTVYSFQTVTTPSICFPTG